MRDTSTTTGQGANSMLGLSVEIEAEAQQKEYYIGPNHKQFHLVATTQLALFSSGSPWEGLSTK